MNRACADGNLTATWVSTTLASGWSLLPLYVGLQAPCVGETKLAQHLDERRRPRRARVARPPTTRSRRAETFGLPAGSPIYFDMEGYAVNERRVHAGRCSRSSRRGSTSCARTAYVSGVYGSAASTIRDIAALGAAKPDAAWIANWNGVEGVFGDPYVSDSLWANHQRVHQYKGGHKETWGGVTINIDNNYVDGARRRRDAAPPPPPPPSAGRLGRLGRQPRRRRPGPTARSRRRSS